MARTILIVDDETSIIQSLEGILADEGFEAISKIEEVMPDLVLLDIWMPDIDGIETLDRIKKAHPHLQVVMMSGHGTIETAVKATKMGAYDFIEKPLSLEKVLLSVNNALDYYKLEEEISLYKEKEKGKSSITGDSEAIRELKEQIKIVAPTNAWVLISGDNGTGKELVAHTIHRLSKRSHKPMVEVNCAAIPEELIESELFGHEKGAFTGAATMKKGKFDLANEGSLFLDEIGDMSLKAQSKTLRILQEQRFERVGGSRTIHPSDRGHEQGPGGRDRKRDLQGRSLFSAQCDPDQGATPQGAGGRHTRPLQRISKGGRAQDKPRCEDDLGGGH